MLKNYNRVIFFTIDNKNEPSRVDIVDIKISGIKILLFYHHLLKNIFIPTEEIE